VSETVTPIALADLPIVMARDALATRLAARGLGALPERATVDLTPLGEVTLAYAGLAPAGEPVAGAVAFRVTRGRHRGRLSLDARLTRALLAALVEQREPPILRRLGSAERGLVAGSIAVVLDRLGSDLGLSLAPPPPGPVAGALVLLIDVAAPAVAGRVALEMLPAMLLDVVGGAVWVARAAALPVVGALEIAATRVPAGALAELAPGDAVVFDGIPALAGSGGHPWRARLVVGDHAAAVLVAPDRAPELIVVEPFQPSGRPAGGDHRVEEEILMEPTPEAVRALASAPVEVVAEIGRVALRGDEVVGLAPGAVITLSGVRGAVVSLRIGGQIWAEGELVNVDGELGVRVTAIHRAGSRPAP